MFKPGFVMMSPDTDARKQTNGRLAAAVNDEIDDDNYQSAKSLPSKEMHRSQHQSTD
jgi:hypothetical protein